MKSLKDYTVWNSRKRDIDKKTCNRRFLDEQSRPEVVNNPEPESKLRIHIRSKWEEYQDSIFSF